MNVGVLCSICRDLFTGGNNETIYSTPCGHVFHYPCLLQWMERTHTCPHCRMIITNKNIFKLNMHFEGTEGPRTGLEDWQQRNSQFELSMKNIELQQLKETSRTSLEQCKGLRLRVKTLEEEAKLVKVREYELLHEIRNLKTKLATEQQKNRRVGNSDYHGIPFDVINLDDDSDPELMHDIDANLQNRRSFIIDEDPEIIDLENSIRENNQPNQPGTEELRNDMELKEVQLASAFARINELEKIIRMKQNEAASSRNAQFL